MELTKNNNQIVLSEAEQKYYTDLFDKYKDTSSNV